MPRGRPLQSSDMLLAQSLWILGALAACECGFSVNSTSSNAHAIFTDLLESDFQHLTSFDYTNPCWWRQVYNVPLNASHGTYGKAALLDNVVVNPVANSGDPSQEGILGGDAGLQLWVRSQLLDGMVPMGEIMSKRDDMSYGSYRVGMKVTAIPGTCGAFFWYHNDSQEIDLEFLSSQYNSSSHPVNLVMQTPESAAAGFNAAGTSTFDVFNLPFLPSDDFHEYRFDWTPDKVSFYTDGDWMYDMAHDYEPNPGHISFNHWSNGNPGWSQGPPTEDAVLTLSYFKAYFNSTSSSSQMTFASKCSAQGQVCQIPDRPVKPRGINDGINWFFAGGTMCGEEQVDIVTASGSPSSTSTVALTTTATTMTAPPVTSSSCGTKKKTAWHDADAATGAKQMLGQLWMAL